MHHGLSDEQVRELSRCWALYDFHEKTYRFLTGCWSTLDFSFAIDGIESMWGYEPEFVDDSVRRSVLASAVDAIPRTGDPADARTVLRLIGTDQDLWKRLIVAVTTGPRNEELEPEFYVEVLHSYCRLSRKPMPFSSVPDPDSDDYRDQIDAFRAALFRLVDSDETTSDGEAEPS